MCNKDTYMHFVRTGAYLCVLIVSIMKYNFINIVYMHRSPYLGITYKIAVFTEWESIGWEI